MTRAYLKGSTKYRKRQKGKSRTRAKSDFKNQLLSNVFICLLIRVEFSESVSLFFLFCKFLKCDREEMRPLRTATSVPPDHKVDEGEELDVEKERRHGVGGRVTSVFHFGFDCL